MDKSLRHAVEVVDGNEKEDIEKKFDFTCIAWTNERQGKLDYQFWV